MNYINTSRDNKNSSLKAGRSKVIKEKKAFYDPINISKSSRIRRRANLFVNYELFRACNDVKSHVFTECKKERKLKVFSLGYSVCKGSNKKVWHSFSYSKIKI